MWGFIEMSHHLMDNFNIVLMGKICWQRNCYIKFYSKKQHRAGKGWRDEPPCHNSVNSYAILQFAM